jgi:GNAT superfamily N-acetyltransferase
VRRLARRVPVRTVRSSRAVAETGARSPEPRVRLEEIVAEHAWSRYLAARVTVEAPYGLDGHAVGGIVARMRAAAGAHPIRWFFVVDGSDVEVGAVGRLAFGTAGGLCWRLQDVDVFPAYRRGGLGNRLLEAVVQLAARDRAVAVFVAADEDDWPLAWYQRHGFERVATVSKPRAAPLSGLVP